MSDLLQKRADMRVQLIIAITAARIGAGYSCAHLSVSDHAQAEIVAAAQAMVNATFGPRARLDGASIEDGHS